MSNRGRHKKKVTKYPNTWLTKVLSNETLDLIFLRAKEQNKSITLQMIERHPTDIDIMIWSKTPEGWNFWNNIFRPVDEFKCQNRL